MDIKLKMGAKSDLPSSKNKGTVYFAKNDDKNFGELYYDDENENRIKVGGANISNIEFVPDPVMALDGVYADWVIRITNEDGSHIDSTLLPKANMGTAGVISPTNLTEIQNMPVGMKKFTPGIVFGNNLDSEQITGAVIDLSALNSDSSGILAMGGKNGFTLGNLDLTYGIAMTEGFLTAQVDDETYFNLTNGYFFTQKLGVTADPIPEANITNIVSDYIISTLFEGSFNGTVNGALIGNASTASKLESPITINTTSFDGSTNIITDTWGISRNIKISDAAVASTSGISVNGSADITLTIPSTMTGFANITSTNLFGTSLGSTDLIWSNLYVKNPFIYNAADPTYFHKLVSGSSSSSGRVLTLPDATGTLAYIGSAIGDENSPCYVSSAGQILACTTIAIDHGGTGRDTLTAGSLLVGNGTNAVTLVAGDTKGKILTANGSTAAPSYASPSFSWVDGAAAGPVLKFSINGAETAAPAIPLATGSASGIVTNAEQTFGGKKIFQGAIQGNSTLEISGSSTFSGLITASNMILTGQLKSSSNATSYSYMTLTDAKITLKSSAIMLDGSKLLLNTTSTNMYGTVLPDTGLEEGRVFFLLT